MNYIHIYIVIHKKGPFRSFSRIRSYAPLITAIAFFAVTGM